MKKFLEFFEFTFEKGKVVDFKAEEGYDTLKEMLESAQNVRSKLSLMAAILFIFAILPNF